MFCEHCGKEVVDDAVVCIHCGRSTSKSRIVSTKRNNVWSLDTIITLIFVLIGAVWIMGEFIIDGNYDFYDYRSISSDPFVIILEIGLIYIFIRLLLGKFK